eukprot:5820599-Pleurochrysis_carterae.AAC.5
MNHSIGKYPNEIRNNKNNRFVAFRAVAPHRNCTKSCASKPNMNTQQGEYTARRRPGPQYSRAKHGAGQLQTSSRVLV